MLLVVSLVFGGSWLAAGDLWFVGVLGWPVSADTPGRVAVATAACALATTGATLASLRAARRAAAR
ncbi:hypothetical protein BJY21_000033 [Kineosphaera limosa]|uniref:Uncharacterized protein n=1 Tax=Kineosphaera limosa NBRC 100340 TaxID=1184609 RepID=K6X7S0_9MICO|nr:hypothetical protein [Kineosphaera limosa]NYD98848.1 hypothetical protein [Kineosphaera limosa]GAB94829.1 hypothetical protein KILIM_012_00130 [Kineosphaera limosa NBRC 100340]